MPHDLLSIVAGGCAGLVGGMLVAALARTPRVFANVNPPVAEDLRAKALELVDKSGRTRMVLATVDEDVYLGIVDKRGKLIATLGTKGDEVSLRLGDAHGEPQAALTLSGNMPSLTIADEKGKRRVALLSAGTNTGLFIADENSTPRLDFGTVHGKAGIDVYNPDGSTAWKAP